MKKKIGAVVGPTASGKTALAIALSRCVDGEIISCDSMQIYKMMDIGTAKPTEEERSAAVHHMIDIVDPWVDYSCVEYAEKAKALADDIINRGKIPVFCGGTGLYLEHVISNTAFSEAGKDDEYREVLKKEIEEGGLNEVYSRLQKIDPEAAEKIHPNNVKRLIRALEIYHVTGKTKTMWDEESLHDESPYEARIICLDFKDREKLYDRINKRVDIMMKMGLEAEVRRLVSGDYPPLSNTALQGIGYKEMIDYFDGKTSLDEAVELIKKRSRNYAKRQLTWFRRYKDSLHIFVDEYEKFDDIVNIAKNVLTD